MRSHNNALKNSFDLLVYPKVTLGGELEQFLEDGYSSVRVFTMPKLAALTQDFEHSRLLWTIGTATLIPPLGLPEP